MSFLFVGIGSVVVFVTGANVVGSVVVFGVIIRMMLVQMVVVNDDNMVGHRCINPIGWCLVAVLTLHCMRYSCASTSSS